MRSQSSRLLLAAIFASLPGLAMAGTRVTPAPSRPAPNAGSARSGDSSGEWLDRTPAMSRSSELPAAAEDCAAIYDPVGHRLVLFGGKDDSNHNVNEVWTLDLADYGWHRIPIEGDTPPPSEDHAVIYDPIGRRMILHGGEDGLTTNKTWSFDLSTLRWRNMTDPTSPAREDADRKSTRLNSSHLKLSRMPSSA